MNPTEPNPDFEALLNYLRQSRGFDFTGYKRSTLVRRVQKRMQTVAIAAYKDYIDYLEVHPDEFVFLFNTILINVTTFFRDQPAWDYLSREIIPQLIQHRQPNQPIRLWSVGCASGQEAYTLAMVLAESLGIAPFRERVKIFATDVDEEALTQARQASYEASEVSSLPPDLRDKYFEQTGSHYVFDRELRHSVIFGRHDLVQDAPISRIDLLVCRNTLMYLNTETQTKVLERFHFAIRNNGFLFLGKAEMLFTRTSLFTPVDLRWRVFTKVLGFNLRDSLAVLTQPVTPPDVDLLQIPQVAFNTDPVAQLVMSNEGFLALANEAARELFHLSARDIGRPLQDLEVSYRPVELRSLIDQVRDDFRAVTLKNVEWSNSTDTNYLDVILVPLLNASSELLAIKVTFTNVTRYHLLQAENIKTNQELETAYEELQSSNEELETTNEELQSTVEELETTNEELQSTNEELETMNEELQSTNEELQAMNEQIHQSSNQLNLVNAFLTSILTSLQSGVVVVDREFCVLIWNQKAEDLWGLRADEVNGRNFLNLDIGLPVAQLRPPIRNCLAGESTQLRQTLVAMNRRGRTINCQVDCAPLLSSGKEIQGVVLLMEAD